MSTATVSYVAQRAELLAQLVLTRRKGVRILSFAQADDVGIDLIAQLPLLEEGHDSPIQPYLCVQVKGTSGELGDERAAAAYCRPHWKPLRGRGLFLAPVVFMLFSMEGDQGYFSWVLQPRVDQEQGPSLTWVEAPEMTRITKKSIDVVLDEVVNWFDAMSDHLLREKSDQ